jgi:4-amino-4-deoxy-L-arabinose transferase-like glycosyltransferase
MSTQRGRVSQPINRIVGVLRRIFMWMGDALLRLLAWARDRLRLTETRALLAVCAGALLLHLWPLQALSTNYDEGMYWSSLRAMVTGFARYNPLFHSQPPVFLASVYPLYLLFGQTLPAARIATLLYALVAIVAGYFVGRALGGRWAGVATTALLALSPLFLGTTRILLPVAPALALGLVGLACALAAPAHTGQRRRWLALASGIALGMAAGATFAAALTLLPALLYLAAPMFTSMISRDGRIRMPQRDWLQVGAQEAGPDLLWFAMGLLGAAILSLAPFVTRLPELWNQAVTVPLEASRALDRGVGANLADLWTVFLNQGLIWLALAALVALALGAWRRAWTLLPLTLWLLAIVIYLLAHHPFDPGDAVWLVAPLAALGGQGIALLAARTSNRSGRLKSANVRQSPAFVTYGVLIALGLALFTGAWISATDNIHATAATADTRILMVFSLATRTLPNDLVATDDPYVAGLAGRVITPEVVDTSRVRVAAGALTTQQLEAIITRTDTRTILFAGGEFDALPGFRAWVEANNFTLAEDFGDGRALYLKQPSGPVPA